MVVVWWGGWVSCVELLGGGGVGGWGVCVFAVCVVTVVLRTWRSCPPTSPQRNVAVRVDAFKCGPGPMDVHGYPWISVMNP